MQPFSTIPSPTSWTNACNRPVCSYTNELYIKVRGGRKGYWGWGAVRGSFEVCGNRFGLALYTLQLISRGVEGKGREANVVQCATYLPVTAARVVFPPLSTAGHNIFRRTKQNLNMFQIYYYVTKSPSCLAHWMPRTG